MSSMFTRLLALACLLLLATALRAADTVVICVTDTLKPKIETELNRWRDDIIAEGDYPRVVIVTVPVGSNQRTVWNTLSAQNTAQDPVKGVLLVGAIPLGVGQIGTVSHYADLIYCDLSQYNPDVKQNIGLEPNKFNWVGRISPIPSWVNAGYSEEAQIRFYLDKNHRFRTGDLRLPHRMFRLGVMADLTATDISAFDQFDLPVIFWDNEDYNVRPTDDIVLSNPRDTDLAVHAGSLYLESYAHGGRDAIVGIGLWEAAQCVVYGGNNCNAGYIGGIVNKMIFQPANLMLLGWSGTEPTGGVFARMSYREGIGAQLKAGRSYGKGHALISYPMTSNFHMVHGDPTIRLSYAASNRIPNITAKSIPTTAVAGVSFPLSVTATDPEGALTQYEWWMRGYNSTDTSYGSGPSKISTTAATTFRYDAPFTGTVWVMARDNYGAFSFVQHNIAVAANPNQVAITATQSLAKESGLVPAQFTITRSGDFSQALALPYTIGGTATTSDRNGGTSGVMNFAADQQTATLTITPVNDTAQEGYETITVSLGDGEGYMVSLSARTAQARIQDDETDNAPLVERVWPKVGDVRLALGTDLWVENTVIDDGATAPTLTWSVAAGPSGASFESSNQAGTRVSFTQPGNYTLRFTARDTANQSTTLDVTVAVATAPLGTTADLLLWLPTDAGTGTRVRDAGPAANHAFTAESSNTNIALQGPTWSTRPDGGGALEFDGSNDLVRSTNNVVFDTTKGLSATAWIRLDAPATNTAAYHIALGLESASNSVGGIFEVDNSSYQLSSRFNNNNATVHRAQVLPQGEWVHVAWTREPSASGGSAVVRLYVNGELGYTGTDTLTSQTRRVQLARNLLSGNFFWKGGLADVRLYSRTLTTEEIQSIHRPTTNHAPRLSVGNATATALATALPLGGTATDDGLPSGSSLTTTWSSRTGPAQPFIASSTNPASTATFATEGNYTLRLTADDGEVRVVRDKPILAFTSAPANAAPVVNAGADTPAKIGTPVFLGATATDDGLGLPHGRLDTTWSEDSGPGVVSFSSQTPATLATFTAPGTYVLRLTATDGQHTVSDTVTVTVAASAVNTAPVITLPATARLIRDDVNGVIFTPPFSAADDGLPGSALTYSWSITQYAESFTSYCLLTNGTTATPTFTFSKNCAPSSTLSFYKFRVAVSDGELTTTQEISVYLDNATNSAPAVNAGADLTVLQPNVANLAATVTDDGYPKAALTTTWSQISGPGTTTFTNAAARTTQASFSAPGTYVLRLTATDSALTTTDDLTVAVTAPTADEPVVGAITAGSPLPLKAASTTLTVTASDDDGSAGLVTTWSVLSAPSGGTATFSPNGTNAAATTTVTINRAGTWRLRATVRDVGGATAWRETEFAVVLATGSITLSPANASVRSGRSQSFTATARDQFGQTIANHPGFVWALDAGSPGACSQNGLYTAGPDDLGTATLRAFDADNQGAATIQLVDNLAPVITGLAVIPGEQLPDRQGGFSASVDDDGPAGTVSYSWSVISGPAGTTWDASNNSTEGFGLNAYFPATGTYTVRLVVTDHRGLTASRDITVSTDVSNPTSISVSPATRTLQPGGTATFTATVLDQVGRPLSSQPLITWSATGAGTISPSGVFTAGATNGTATITATALGLSSTATVTVTNTAPTANITRPTKASLNLPDLAESLVLEATATDAQVTPTVSWTQVSGPGTATFANASAANTSVRFSADGTYVLRITVSDGLLSATDEQTVVVGTGGSATATEVLRNTFETVASTTGDSLNYVVNTGTATSVSRQLTGNGTSAAATNFWTVTDSTTLDLSTQPRIRFTTAGNTSYTWGDATSGSATSLLQGGLFTSLPDFSDSAATPSWSSGTSNRNLVVSGAPSPLPGNRAVNFLFEIKSGAEPFSAWQVRVDAGATTTSGTWYSMTALQSGNLDATLYQVNTSTGQLTEVVGFGQKAIGAVTSAPAAMTLDADNPATSLNSGTYLLQIAFIGYNYGQRIGIDNLRLFAATSLPATPQVNPGTAPAAQANIAATLSGTASADATWSLVSGPGTATFANANSANTTVTFSAAGTYVLRLSATDATATVFQDLAVNVTSSNTAPTISTITAQTIAANGSTGALAFTIDDAQTSAASLTVNSTSSNTTLIPNGNLTLGGSGASRTITVVPAANQIGSATITLLVSDGDITAQSTFTVSVTETLASWIATQSGVGALTAATDDPDGDGLANLLEYALGTEPGNAASGTAPQGDVDGNGKLTLSFTPQRVNGLTYLVGASNDLSDWSDATDVTALLTPGQAYTHTDGTAVTTRRFLRLKVTTP